MAKKTSKTVKPPEAPEKLDLRSHNVVDDKLKVLLDLFPEAEAESGQLDFDRLRLALGDSVDVGKERYGMNWPGKADCFKTIQIPSLGTLQPCPDKSVNFDTTENLIIEGDNLEVLKLLQKSYLGKVKMIYIDPPYNTGNDFIYPDNYTESLQTYLEYTGQVDSEGKKFNTNADTDGRFHSRWLNMMYPRLYLARNLLSEEGIVLVSIDSNELHNLIVLLNDVFGENNALVQFVFDRQSSPTAGIVAERHEYIVAYVRNIQQVKPIAGGDGEIVERAIKKPSKKNAVSSISFPAGFPFLAPDGTELSGRIGDKEPFTIDGKLKAENGLTVEPISVEAAWAQKTQITDFIDGLPVVDTKGQNIKEFFFDERGKLHYRKDRTVIVPTSILTGYGSGSKQSGRLAELFDGEVVFDNPKPVSALHDFVQWFCKDDDLAMELFAGAGPLAEAVLINNKERGAQIKFVLVQLPERVDEESPARKFGLSTISDITTERVRRVIKKLQEDGSNQLDLGDSQSQDLGFKVLKLDESNFTTWDADMAHDPDVLEEQLDIHINHIRDGRSQEDILYELLLKSGFSLTTEFEEIELEGKTVYSVAEGLLLICLEQELTLELIRAMADLKPERVCLSR